MTENVFQVYTDGSCNTKLKIGAWAAIIIHNESIKTISNYTLDTTNNRMELSAVINSLEHIDNESIEKPTIKLYTDSQYVEKLPGREKKFIENNYLTKKGEPIQNVDLVQKLLYLFHRLKVEFIKVKAHQKKTDEKNYNIDVDKLSRKIVRDYIKNNNLDYK